MRRLPLSTYIEKEEGEGGWGTKLRSREGKGRGYRMGKELIVHTPSLAIDTLIRVRNASEQVVWSPLVTPLHGRSDGRI